jgi:type IX secretion system PorP/SprF family membrane protein
VYCRENLYLYFKPVTYFDSVPNKPNQNSLPMRHIFTLLFYSCTALLAAQDLHFSQFYHNPLHLNPALTGIYRGDFRVAAQHRSQWTSVPVRYRTYTASADAKLVRRRNNMLSGGLQIQHDQAGDAGLKWTQMAVLSSVAHILNEKQAVSVGFGMGFVQRSFDVQGLKFRNQWNGDVFDPNRSTGENFSRSSGLSPTLSAGFNWHFEQIGSRTRIDAGIGFHHLNRPKVEFRDDPKTNRLSSRASASIVSVIQLNEAFDLTFFAGGQKMGLASEIEAGGGVRSVLSSAPGRFTALQFTLATRLKDALIPALQLEFESWTLGLSYDWNISKFEVATRNRGGFEMAAIYRPIPVPLLPSVKVCPIF